MTPKAPDQTTSRQSVSTTAARLTSPRSLVELAYDEMLSMLVTMKIKPGEHIGIESLARELGISQTPIREALTLLEAQRLAYKIPNVGFRAAHLLSPPDVDSLFEMRLMLEPRAAALAAQRAGSEELEALAVLAAGIARVATGTDVAYTQFADGDAKLHHLIATASGNIFLADAVEGLHAHIHIFRYLYRTNAPQKAVREHAVLIDALLARDSKAAEAAMRAHLLASQRRMTRMTKLRDTVAQEDAPGRGRNDHSGRLSAKKRGSGN